MPGQCAQASASGAASGEGATDFGSSRLALVPALDSFEDAAWCVMQDSFGKRNGCGIQVH